MTMFDFLKPRKSPERVQIVQRDPLRLTVEQFRRDPELVKKAAAALQNPDVRLMVDCLWASHLGRSLPLGDPPDERIARADRAIGYQAAIIELESLAVWLEPNTEPPVDFAPENAEVP